MNLCHLPCNASELVHFRKRIGEKGIELILAESIRVNDDRNGENHHDTAFIDSTVQEKNVTYPTDSKLHKKIVGKVLKIAKLYKMFPCNVRKIKWQLYS